VTDRIARILDPFVDEPLPPPTNIEAQRGNVRRATPSEDPLNAIVNWCRVSAGREGLLAGKRIGLKDNMALAGVPMTLGSRLLETYVPAEDCLVAQRLLAAGAEVVAKLNMDGFAWSAGGETSDFGPILNPVDPSRTASGSSGGSAAALAYEHFDITFGTDQAGSIRLPAAWCGVLGLKPTHSLLPYTGIVPLDPAYDHVGPLARSVEDLALALQAVAGEHESDPRQCRVPAANYMRAVAEAPDDLRGLSVGIVTSAFHASADDAAGTRETSAATFEAIECMAGLGAELHELAVPEHDVAAGLSFAACLEAQAAMSFGFGQGYHWSGHYAMDLGAALGRALARDPNALPPSLKMVLLMGTHLRERYFGALYAKAQNLLPAVRHAYDRLFEEVDVLVMPTATHYAHRHEPDASLSERVERGDSMIRNTAVFNGTGHPALSIPAAEADALPVGVMLVGRRFADGELLSLARTYEAQVGWRPRRDP
jgi:amidase